MTTKKKRTHNYPENRKSRDTSYAESTQLLEKHDKQWIHNIWKHRGPDFTADYFNTSKNIIRYIAQKHGWIRPAGYTPNILKAVQRGNADPDDYDSLYFEPAMLKLDPDQNKDRKYSRECNPHATWDYVDPRKPTTYRKLPYLEEAELPCIRQEIEFLDETDFLVIEALPDLCSMGYLYLFSLPTLVIYFDLIPFNYSWKRYKAGDLIPSEIEMIQTIAEHYKIPARRAIKFFRNQIDSRIHKLNRRIKEALVRKMDQIEKEKPVLGIVD